MSAHRPDSIRIWPPTTPELARARARRVRVRVAIVSAALLAVVAAGAWIAISLVETPSPSVAEPAPVETASLGGDGALAGGAADEITRLLPPAGLWRTERGEASLARTAPSGAAPESAGADLILRLINRRGGAPVPDLPLGVRAVQSGKVWKGRTDGDGRAATSIAQATGKLRLWIDERSDAPPSVPWRLELEELLIDERQALQPELEIAVLPAVLDLRAEVESPDGAPADVVEDGAGASSEAFVQRGGVWYSPGTGGPVALASKVVQVYFALENAPGDDPLDDSCTQTCPVDASGSARFFLFDPRSLGARARIWAVRSDGLQSEALLLTPPLGAGPWRLLLREPAKLAVAVRQHDGSPAARCFVRVESRDGGSQLFAEGRGADALGRASFDRVPSGEYKLSVRDDRTQTASDVEIVVLAPGEAREMRVDLPEPSAPIAIAGAVLDERGAPLPNVLAWIEVEGRAEVALCTDEEGRFEHRAPTAARVRVRLADGVLDPLFEPCERVAAFGARDLVFRRMCAPKNSSLSLEFRDSASGELIENVRMRVAAQREPEGRLAGVSSDGARRGPAAASNDGGDFAWRGQTRELALTDQLTRNGGMELHLQPGRHLRALFESTGFRRAEADLDMLLAAQVSARSVVTVLLERGFACELRVRDAVTRAPIAGALCVAPGLRAALSDSSGVVRFSGTTWPANVTVERDGYRTRRWSPVDGALQEILWLEPASAATASRE